MSSNAWAEEQWKMAVEADEWDAAIGAGAHRGTKVEPPTVYCRVEVNYPLGDGWEFEPEMYYTLRSAQAYAEWAAIERVETRVVDARTDEVLWASGEGP